MNSVLETKKLSKKYGHYYAVNQVDMHIQKGDVYGYIGKNGAGKTTLMKMVCGLINPTSGSYTIFGEKNPDKARKRVGSLIESPALYPKLSCRENLNYYCKLHGISTSKVPQMLSYVGLDKAMDKHAQALSLGMKQRLSIAIAILNDPEFLILDEPINGLDPEGIMEVRNLMISLNQEKGMTILISSHILGELEKVATRYGIISAGKIVMEATAEELERLAGANLFIETNNAERAAEVIKASISDIDLRMDSAASRVYLGNHETDVAAINRLLVTNGFNVSRIAEEKADIEKYFIDVTGGAENE